MVREAEAAGFNPLTALRNGGAAGFSVSTTPAAPLSARLADGIAGGVNAFLQNFDPHADAAREKGFALIDAQIRNLNASSGAIFPPPPAGFHNLETRRSGGGGQLSAELPASAGAPRTPTVEDPTLTNPFPTTSGLHVNPGWPDAAAAEERWGDLGGSIYGLGIGAVDAWYNVQRSRTARDEYWRPRLGAALSERSEAAKRRSREREQRLRRDAARNARDLGFPGHW